MPATVIGIQPCNRKRRPTWREEQSSSYRLDHTPGPSRGTEDRDVDACPSRTEVQRGSAARIGVDQENQPRPDRAAAANRPAMDPTEGPPRQRRERKIRDPPSGSGLADAECRRPIEPLAKPAFCQRRPRHHADRFVRSCAFICDIRIGPSENSPTLARSVRPRR